MSDPIAYAASDWRHQYSPEFCDAYCAWLETHGIDKNATIRTEHHVIDAPLIRAFQVIRDESGIVADPQTGEPAQRTVDVLIRTAPPRPEDYR